MLNSSNCPNFVTKLPNKVIPTQPPNKLPQKGPYINHKQLPCFAFFRLKAQLLGPFPRKRLSKDTQTHHQLNPQNTPIKNNPVYELPVYNSKTPRLPLSRRNNMLEPFCRPKTKPETLKNHPKHTIDIPPNYNISKRHNKLPIKGHPTLIKLLFCYFGWLFGLCIPFLGVLIVIRG